MIFDLTSPGRKTAVRIIFGFLAFIFAVGFICLGIGSGRRRRPFDSRPAAALDRRRVRAADRGRRGSRREEPRRPEALVSLVVLRTQSGDAQLEIDEETQQPDRAHGGLARGVRGGDLRLAGLPGLRAQEDQTPRRPARPSSPTASRGHRGRDRGAARRSPSRTRAGPTSARWPSYSTSTSRSRRPTRPATRRSPRRTRRRRSSSSKQLEQLRKQAVKAEEEQKEAARLRAAARGSELSDPFGGLSPDRSRPLRSSLTLATIDGPRAVSSAGRAGDS